MLLISIETVFLQSDPVSTIFHCSFFCGYYLTASISLGSPQTSTMVWIKYIQAIQWQMLKHCQYFVQPLSPAVSRRNESFNMNCPSASLLTRKYLHTCACAAQVATFTIWGQCFSLRASSCAALFEGSIHSKKYGIFNNAISVFMVMYFHCDTQFFLPSLSFPVFPTRTLPFPPPVLPLALILTGPWTPKNWKA